MSESTVSPTPDPASRTLELKAHTSDGDAANWLMAPEGWTRNDEYYLKAVGKTWAKDLYPHLPAEQFTLRELPNGYAGFEKMRSNGKTVDRYVYGHTNDWFHSTSRFYVHFKHMMDTGSAAGCKCYACSLPGPRRNRRTISRGPRHTRASRFKESDTETSDDEYRARNTRRRNSRRQPISEPVSEQDLPQQILLASHVKNGEVDDDIYAHLLDAAEQLQQGQYIDELVSINTLLYKEEHYIDNAKAMTLWQEEENMPRSGDLVLCWQRGDDSTTISSLSSIDLWTIGVVRDIAVREITADCPDRRILVKPLFDDAPEFTPLSSRVLPIQLCLNALITLPSLHGIDAHAFRAMTRTVSLLHACHVSARKVDSVITMNVSYTGIYVGAELIVLGDLVKLSEAANESALGNTTLLRISNIVLKSKSTYDGTGPQSKRKYLSKICIKGQVFTTSREQAYVINQRPQPLADDDICPAMRPYGMWYWMTDPDNSDAVLTVPLDRVQGRLYDAGIFKSSLLISGLSIKHDVVVSIGQHELEAESNLNDDSLFWAENRSDEIAHIRSAYTTQVGVQPIKNEHLQERSRPRM